MDTIFQYYTSMSFFYYHTHFSDDQEHVNLHIKQGFVKTLLFFSAVTPLKLMNEIQLGRSCSYNDMCFMLNTW